MAIIQAASLDDLRPGTVEVRDGDIFVGA